MPIAMLILAFTATPKVQDPETILHKFDNIAFKDTKLSLRGLNTLEVTRKMASTDNTQFSSYGNLNISNRRSEAGFKLAWRFK